MVFKKLLSFILIFWTSATASIATVKPYNEVLLRTSDKINIAINHYENGHKEVLIIAPGWFMAKDSRPFLDMAKAFGDDYDVIVMDFRGHGKSSGFYTFSSKETKDLKTVVDFAKQKYDKVYLMGFSLGGAVSIIHGVTEKNLDKMIIVSAPSSFEHIENQMWKKEAWFWTFKKFEWKTCFSVRPSLIIQSKIRPIDVIYELETPTLFIAGGKDPTVHPWHTRSLYEQANCEKQLEVFEKSTHAEDLFLQEPGRFIKTCKNWLNH